MQQATYIYATGNIHLCNRKYTFMQQEKTWKLSDFNKI